MGYIFVFTLLGIIAGCLFAIDICYKPRNKGSFIKILLIVFGTQIPLITGSLISNSMANEAKSYLIYFYIGFILALVTSIIVIYFRSFLPLLKDLKMHKNTKRFTLLDMFRGYDEFKAQYDKEWNKVVDENNLEREKYQTTLDDIRPYFLTFIHDINSYSSFYELDLESYLKTIIPKFIDDFFGRYNARLTIREYNKESNSMVTKLTTRTDAIPGPVPLDQINMISKSAELNKPLIFSENPNFHYSTDNNSIKKRVYMDYVTYCLLESDDSESTPYYSISLDVKNEAARLRMKTLVHSLGFDILCWTLIKKIIHETTSYERNNF